MWVGFQPSSSSYRSVTTGWRESVLKGRAVMNRSASAVMTTCTSKPCLVSWLARSAALCAAIEPGTPRMMFLPVLMTCPVPSLLALRRGHAAGPHLLRLHDGLHPAQVLRN